MMMIMLIIVVTQSIGKLGPPDLFCLFNKVSVPGMVTLPHKFV